VTIVLLVVMAAAAAAALYIVVKSLRNVDPGPLPESLKTAPPDTALVNFRASMARKTRALATRCRLTRKRWQGKLTPEQDSLGRDCDIAIEALRSHVEALKLVKREDRKSASDSLRAEYSRAKASVNKFTRSVLKVGDVPDDSLDAELKKLMGE
jgi:hypothetical protein